MWWFHQHSIYILVDARDQYVIISIIYLWMLQGAWPHWTLSTTCRRLVHRRESLIDYIWVEQPAVHRLVSCRCWKLLSDVRLCHGLSWTHDWRTWRFMLLRITLFLLLGSRSTFELCLSFYLLDTDSWLLFWSFWLRYLYGSSLSLLC